MKNRTSAPPLAPTFVAAERALLKRWPEHRLEPSLERIRALTVLLGRPQSSYLVVHLTGTNGKTSIARMTDELLRSHGWHTGRFTSPHLEAITERVSLHGADIPDEQFVRNFVTVETASRAVDASSPHPVSFFEAMVALGLIAFAEAGVEAAVIEVGMGGRWDATNVADGDVAVIAPISLDHVSYLGHDVRTIATEKAGIIKAGATVVSARQPRAVLDVIEGRASEMGATLLLEGRDFGVIARAPSGDHQRLTIEGLAGTEVVDLPLVGAHQAQNAAVSLVAAQAAVRCRENSVLKRAAEGFAKATSPGRLELLDSRPPLYLDAAHNPAGIEALNAAANEMGWRGAAVVLGTMADKDVNGVLQGLSRPWVARIICSQAAGDRALPARQLAQAARGALHVPVTAEDDLAAAIKAARADPLAVVTGSVALIGEARALLRHRKQPVPNAGSQ